MIECEQRPYSSCLMFKHRRHPLCVQSARTAAAALIPLHLFCFAPLISPRFLHPPSKCLFVHVSFMTGAPWLSNHFFLAAGGSDRALEQKRVVWQGAFTCHEESIKRVRKNWIVFQLLNAYSTAVERLISCKLCNRPSLLHSSSHYLEWGR